MEYTNRIPEDDFQVCSKHERAERGSASEPMGNTLKGGGFEFREFSLINILLIIISFYSFPHHAYTSSELPSAAKNFSLQDGQSKNRGST